MRSGPDRFRGLIAPELARIANVLGKPVVVDLNVNDLRIIVGCFRAVAYLAEIEGEAYLDAESIALHERLETLYQQAVAHEEPEKG
jgi:hypothetical protein